MHAFNQRYNFGVFANLPPVFSILQGCLSNDNFSGILTIL